MICSFYHIDPGAPVLEKRTNCAACRAYDIQTEIQVAIGDRIASRPWLSVISIGRDISQQFGRSLRVLARYAAAPKVHAGVELIVVDDGSIIPMLDCRTAILGIRELPFSRVVYLRSNSVIPRNCAFARNAGAQLARGDVLFFVDGEKMFLTSPLAELETLAEQAGSAVVFPCLRPVDSISVTPLWQSCATGLVRETICFHRAFVRAVVDPADLGTLAIRRREFWHLGGFPESRRGWGREDRALVANFVERIPGAQLVTGQAVGFHQNHPSFIDEYYVCSAMGPNRGIENPRMLREQLVRYTRRQRCVWWSVWIYPPGRMLGRGRECQLIANAGEV